LLSSLGDYIFEIHTTKEFEKDGNISDPQDITGFTFSPEEKNGIQQKAKVTDLQPVHHKAVIELMDGSQHLIDYHLLMEKFNALDDNGDKICTFSSFLDHRKTKKGKWELLVEWNGVGYIPSWEPLSRMKEADPTSCAVYARENKLFGLGSWKWANASRLMHLE